MSIILLKFLDIYTVSIYNNVINNNLSIERVFIVPNKLDMSLFAQRLKEARKSKGLTQKELSDLSGVSTVMISQYERSEITSGKNPALNNVYSIAAALEVSLDWLCGFSFQYTKAPIVDFIKMLVALDETSVIAFDDVDFLNEQIQSDLGKAYATITDDDIIENAQLCEAFGADLEMYRFVAYFKDDYIQRFIRDWQKMRELYKSRTIDKDLYTLWLNKQYSDIGTQIKKDEEFIKELDLQSKAGD